MKLKFLSTVLFVFLKSLIVPADPQIPYEDIKRNDQILVYLAPLKKWEPTRVSSVGVDGRVSFLVYRTTMAQNWFELWSADPSSIVRENVEETQKWSGQILCLNVSLPGLSQGSDVRLDTVYQNGLVKVSVGDFFGLRLLVFQRPEIVTFANLKECPGI